MLTYIRTLRSIFWNDDLKMNLMMHIFWNVDVSGVAGWSGVVVRGRRWPGILPGVCGLGPLLNARSLDDFFAQIVFSESLKVHCAEVCFRPLNLCCSQITFLPKLTASNMMFLHRMTLVFVHSSFLESLVIADRAEKA